MASSILNKRSDKLSNAIICFSSRQSETTLVVTEHSHLKRHCIALKFSQVISHMINLKRYGSSYFKHKVLLTETLRLDPTTCLIINIQKFR